MVVRAGADGGSFVPLLTCISTATTIIAHDRHHRRLHYIQHHHHRHRHRQRHLHGLSSSSRSESLACKMLCKRLVRAEAGAWIPTVGLLELR